MKHYFLMLVLIPGLFLIILACGDQATATPVSVPEPTSSPTPTLPPASTATPVPTATIAPTVTLVPTATKEPTATPVPAATPSPTATAEPTATPPPLATNVPLGTPPVTVGPSKDNTLYEDGESFSNGSGQYIFAGNNNREAARRGVIAFDITDNIPGGSSIESVTLTLNLSRTQSASQDIQLRRLLAEWGEGVSDADTNEGGGIAAETGDATWSHSLFDTVEWRTPGGDFLGEASASETVSGMGRYTWGSTSQMVADVQGWLDDPSTNFGWLIMGNESEMKTSKRFDSKESSEEANRPSLTIEFKSPGNGQEADSNIYNY